ncbi:MAG: Ppx/GppA family phosphatase [Pseudomonadota bacterium]
MINKSADDQAAIIDIGSNSVRLIVYRLLGSSALPYINEKVMAGLGRGLSEAGVMSNEAIDEALDALVRYRAILKALGVTRVDAVATAAVRRANNRLDFTARAEAIIGQDLRILSGEDEGRLAALGVAAGLHEPKGLVGDLGGSSLELVPTPDHSAGRPGETHFLGPFALDDGEPFDERRIRMLIRQRLETSERVKDGYERFYAVGGAWRALAKLDMEMRGYPLRILHAYQMNAGDVRKCVRTALASVNDTSVRSTVERLSRRRVKTLPYAALVLDELMAATGAKNVVVSSNGLREGVLWEPRGADHSDPLRDGAIALFDLNETQVSFGEQLHRFVRAVLAPEPDLFGSLSADERIETAACLLADSGWRFHPDHRADLVFEQVLLAPLLSTDHAERLFLATAVASRHQRKFERPKRYAGLLSPAQVERAGRLGALMRLGCEFSGRSAANLASASLQRTPDTLVLRVPAIQATMVSSMVVRRLGQAAATFDLQPDVTIED